METQSESLFLSADEQDIAARLANYSRRIRELRKLDGPVPENMTSMEGLETPDKASGRRRGRPVSVAETYRHARQVQRLVQGVSIAQALLTSVLAAMTHAVLALYMFGFACGLAASFARVQRAHALCTVFNLAYLLSSLGCPLALVAALMRAGSASKLVHALPRHPASWSLIMAGVLAGISSILGAILAAYVLARPLQLYRYESVAASEEAADRRSERSDGKRR